MGVTTTPPFVVSELAPDRVGSFASLTYPLFRRQLHGALDPRLIAVGAEQDGTPIGFALAEARTDRLLSVLSLFVSPTHRGAGLGKQLLASIEAAGAARGLTEARLSYTTGAPSTAAVQQLLHRRGWTELGAGLRCFLVRCRDLGSAPWLWRSYPLPAGFSCTNFAELDWDDYQDIQARQHASPWYPTELDPFTADRPLHRRTSLALRHGRRVVGWLVTHHVEPDLLRYTSLFVDPAARRIGCTMAMMTEVVRRQVEDATIDRILCSVPCDNDRWLHFAARRIAPLAHAVRETRNAVKSLEAR